MLKLVYPKLVYTAIEIMVGHWSWLTRFPIQLNNLFLKFCGNDWSLNETILTPKCNKLHVFDMAEKMRRKKFVQWVLSLYATKCYEAKVNSFCIGKFLIKINIVQTQLWEKVFLQISQNSWETKITPWLTSHRLKTVCLMIN